MVCIIRQVCNHLSEPLGAASPFLCSGHNEGSYRPVQSQIRQTPSNFQGFPPFHPPFYLHSVYALLYPVPALSTCTIRLRSALRSALFYALLCPHYPPALTLCPTLCACALPCFTRCFTRTIHLHPPPAPPPCTRTIRLHPPPTPPCHDTYY